MNDSRGMKLWKLYPRPDHPDASESIKWETYENKVFRLVVRAETEGDARRIASHAAGSEDEVSVPGLALRDRRSPSVWLDPDCTVCEELTCDGLPGIVLKGIRAG